MKIDIDRAIEVLSACGYECDEIESLRQQLAVMTAERDKAKAMPMRYRRMEFNAQLQDENESLRQQLNAAQEEITVDEQRVADLMGDVNHLGHLLAASQKREVMLRDAITEGLSTYKVPMTARIIEALAATAELDGLILCEKEPIIELGISDGTDDMPWGTKLYRACEPKP